MNQSCVKKQRAEKVFMNDKNPEDDIERLRADRKRLLDTLQTLLTDAQTF